MFLMIGRQMDIETDEKLRQKEGSRRGISEARKQKNK